MRHRRSWFVPALLVAAVTAVGLAPGMAVAQEEDDGRLVVGRLELDPCGDVDGAWCGRLRVPFDQADPDAGTIPVNFEWYPAEQAATGTIVAMEGGPGYPSTGTRDYYLELFAGLQRTQNLLLVDSRGTGTSGLVNCRPLQRWRLALGEAEYDRRLAACGDQLQVVVAAARAGVAGAALHGHDGAHRRLLGRVPLEVDRDRPGGRVGAVERHPEVPAPGALHLLAGVEGQPPDRQPAVLLLRGGRARGQPDGGDRRQQQGRDEPGPTMAHRRSWTEAERRVNPPEVQPACGAVLGRALGGGATIAGAAQSGPVR